MRKGESGGAVPRRFLRFRWNVPHAALFSHALFLLPAECFLLLSLRRPHFFQQRKKWGKERRQRPMVFGIPSGQFRCGGKRFRRESTASLPSLPLTWHAESNGRPPVWAIIKSRTCRRLRQVSVRPAGPRPRARNIPFENKSAGRCGRRVRALRLPVRKKERPPKRSFFFGSELSSN